MRFRRKNELQISEAELASATKDLDELHRATFPALQEELSEWSELTRSVREGAAGVASASASRRTFLLGSGVTAGALVLAACSKSGSKTSTTGTTAAGGSSASGGLSGDTQFMAMSASLENLAVGTYQAGITAATAGKLGAVPPAVVTFAQTAMSQHKDHAAAFNAVVTATGHPNIDQPDPVVKPMVDQAFAGVKDVAGLAKLALLLENTAASTYQAGLGTVGDHKAISALATIQPVERQHAAILHFVLGEYPVPDVFSKTDLARPASDIGS